MKIIASNIDYSTEITLELEPAVKAWITEGFFCDEEMPTTKNRLKVVIKVLARVITKLVESKVLSLYDLQDIFEIKMNLRGANNIQTDPPFDVDYPLGRFTP